MDPTGMTFAASGHGPFQRNMPSIWTCSTGSTSSNLLTKSHWLLPSMELSPSMGFNPMFPTQRTHVWCQTLGHPLKGYYGEGLPAQRTWRWAPSMATCVSWPQKFRMVVTLKIITQRRTYFLFGVFLNLYSNGQSWIPSKHRNSLKRLYRFTMCFINVTKMSYPPGDQTWLAGKSLVWS